MQITNEDHQISLILEEIDPNKKYIMLYNFYKFPKFEAEKLLEYMEEMGVKDFVAVAVWGDITQAIRFIPIPTNENTKDEEK